MPDTPAPQPARKPATRPANTRRRIMALALIAILVTYGGWCVLLYRFQDQMMFPRDYAPRAVGEPPAEAVVLARAVADETTVAWLLPPLTDAARNAEGKAPLLVYLHGNAEIIDQQIDVVWVHRALGFAVLLPEFRGYGRSRGTPSEPNIADDAHWSLEQALARGDIDGSRVVYHGRSLGGGAAGALARRRKPDALVLESTFTSAAAMAGKYFVPSVLVKNPFRTDDAVASLDAPVLVVHGTRDPVIPVAHGRKLGALSPRVTYREWDFYHDDLFALGFGREYATTLIGFLRANVPGLAPKIPGE